MSDEQLDRIKRWNLMLAIRLRDGLANSRNARLSSPADRRFASAITTFAVNGKIGRQLQDALWAQKRRSEEELSALEQHVPDQQRV